MEDSRAALEEIRAALAEVNGQLRVLVAQYTVMGSRQQDHEQRIRELERAPKGVTPRQMWGIVTAAVAVFAILAPYIASAVNHLGS